MTCIEFRAQFEKSINDRKSGLPGEEHILTCPSCREYTRSLNILIEQLQNIPRVDIPGELLAKIQSIPDSEKELEKNLGWKKDTLRTTAYVFAGVSVYLFSTFASPTINFIGSNLLFLVSILIVAINMFKRPILGYNG